jgi:arylsulfatase A-like enzyme
MGVTSGVRGVLCLAVATTALSACRNSDRLTGSTNIVVITLDTTRADRLGAYGSRAGLTPRLDKLASRADVYSHVFSTAPLTLPAHASIFSGLYPYRHRARVNGTDTVGTDVPLIAEELRRAGLSTAAVIGSIVVGSRSGLARGFDAFDERFAENETRRYGDWIAERPADEVVDRAIAWLNGNGSKRFFLWVHLYDPHAPYKGSYDEEVRRVDGAVGRLLDTLAEHGVADRTLVVVAGDHGESLGEHGEETHGVFLYDATLRVPLIVVRPGQKRGRRIDAPVSLADVAPTLRDAAGLPAGDADGQSLWKADPERARAVYAESTYAASLIGWSPLRALRTLTHKYIEAPRPELYDLGRDPQERLNVAASDIEPARRLPRTLAALRRHASGTVTRSEIQPEDIRQLAALGYLTPSSAAADPDRFDPSLPDPKDRIDVWNGIERGIIARQAGRYEEAIDLLEGVVRRESAAPTAVLRELSMSLRRSRRTPRALEVYRQLTSRGDAIADDFFGLGVTRHLLDDRRGAIEAYRRAVAIDPKHESAWINLGQELLASGALAEAEGAFLRAAAVNPRSVDALAGTAAVAFERRDYGAARARLEQALALDPINDQAKQNLALVVRATNQEHALVR